MPASHQNCFTSLKAVCCNKTKLIKERKMRPRETAKFDAVILENVFNFTPLSLSFCRSLMDHDDDPLSLQQRTPAPKPFDERAHSMQPTGNITSQRFMKMSANIFSKSFYLLTPTSTAP